MKRAVIIASIVTICSVCLAGPYPTVTVFNPFTGKLDYTLDGNSVLSRHVPYTGARRGVNLGTHGMTTDHLQFAFSPVSTLTVGMMRWNAAKGTADLHMGYDSVIQQIGMEQYFPPVRANAGAISNGQVVMVNPASILSGERFNVIPAITNGTYPTRLVIGMATMDIANNQTGYVTTFGEVHDLSLSAMKPAGETWTAGEILWCNPAVNGGLTDTEPSAPNLKLAVAVVQKVSGNDLDLFVRFEIEPGLSDLQQVNISGLSYEDFLVYNSVAGRWENKQAANISSIVTSAKFTHNSTYTAAHNRALVDPHPAPGSNRNVAYNNYGAWAGASMLNYSGGRVGVGIVPVAPLHVSTSFTDAAVSPTLSVQSTTPFAIENNGRMVTHIDPIGNQAWNLYPYGRIQYTTPGNLPGIIFYTAGPDASYANMRSALTLRGYGMTIVPQSANGFGVAHNGFSVGNYNTATGSTASTAFQATLDIKASSSGVMTNDLTSVDKNSASSTTNVAVGGTYTGTSPASYIVTIDGTGTPNTFKWNKNGGAYTTGVSVTGSAQTISDGITINFGTTTGFTINKSWYITAGRALKIQDSAGLSLMECHTNGNVGINQSSPTSKLHVSGLLAYGGASPAAARTAAATAGILTRGAFFEYSTAGARQLMVY